MRIGAVLPHLGEYGGTRRFLELGNVFIQKGINYTIFTNDGSKCKWFNYKGEIKNCSNIKSDYIFFPYPPSFRIFPKVKGKIFIYVIAGGRFLHGYKAVYGKHPFIINNRIFFKYFSKAHLIEGGVNTKYFYPRKRKVLFYDDPRPCKNSLYIKKQLGNLENIELIGLKGLNNKEIAEAYRTGDYFVSWESREGWSNLSAEAIASGLTVVTNGRGCEPFQDRIIKVKNLREFFQNPMEEFSWETVADKILNIFLSEKK